MNFDKLQEGVYKNALAYGKKYSIKIDEKFSLMKLYEEVGELAQAFLIHRKKSRPEKYLTKKESKKLISQELADVVGMAIVIAKKMNINLEESIHKKWINRKEDK